ncbi:hypothetical protein OED52_16645 [Rhodococcus sp. Z13]|uniref:Uncharacterized protein n=1 Tax=Rhodococcus sacchari TaxID=2962047 RepID=A0ACD4DDW8_9NOCA|nr:DUF6764 family protein [Rhodococcus sp. Z13]UYP18272.1 hypothetical protein OED52_16645 [Rhodococcus sp. Z13]
MSIRSFRSLLTARRSLRAGVLVALGVASAAVLGTGTAAAAPVTCVSPPSPNEILVSETASCGATATDAFARSYAADSGTAVSVAESAGAAEAHATGFGTALSAARGGGRSFAYALGGGLSHSWAEGPAITLSVAGWGSGATADTTGVTCVGAQSFAVNTATGRWCALGLGSTLR